MSANAISLRQAELADINALEQLLNRCYRHAEGWTNEADLIGGIRITAAELAAVIAEPKHYLFVYPKTDTGNRDGIETGELLGCIAVDMQDNADKSSAYIGMFAVHPELQGQGIGHQMLQAAETFANRHLQSRAQPSHITMSILSHRPELLAYYERRGYRLSGASMPFPDDGNNGEPKRADLQLLALEKIISS
ncbi:GNAT family N-acetyltransferase [Psychrobacter urativorans]|uniref:Acetyltransferase n=1 Tax=Psychrobacter urativorans TaxID=45610 RepID=A0A0M3V912_9GAMM|nr:GNAT family N-acetyltransferase [Psychrobacter urativorans]ALF60143.1 acetyltransferase [Psychrobacter urativorans]